MAGIVGRLLHVDLTTRQTRVEELSETVMRTYLGGGALAAHILLRDLAPGVDPLGPNNVLVFTTSVLNGLSLSGTNRYTAAAKSPLTGGYGESEAGGWWGPELRAAGWDGVVIHERLVRFAAIVNQLKHFHGRGGLGAVMGAKNLKAIAVRGSKPPVAADKDGAKRALAWFREHYDRSKDDSTSSARRARCWRWRPPVSCPPATSATARSSTPRPSAAR